MQLQKVYLFPPAFSQYGVLHDFTRGLSNALNRQGVLARIIEPHKDDPKGFLDAILTDPPDCTLSFNGLLPDSAGHFLCDMIKIPHVACLTDSPNRFFPLVQSPRTIMTCVDQDFCQVYRDFQCDRTIFLPHAISKSTVPPLVAEPIYDVLMLNSFIDYDAIRQDWKTHYPKELQDILDEAAEWALTDYQKPYLQAFVQTMDRHLKAGKNINLKQINYEELLVSLEAYIGGKSRAQLLRSIRDVTVHVFGSHEGLGWKKYLDPHQSNIRLHGPVPFSEAIELMKKAKIILNSIPEIKQGLHERILNGLACGAAVLSLRTPFLQEHFKDGEEILLYHPLQWEEVNTKLHHYLEDETARYQLAGRGREKVMQHHTWDHRAQTLMRELPAHLEKIKAQQDE